MCYTYTELTPKQSLQRILHVLSRFSSIPHQHRSLPKEWVKIPCIVASHQSISSPLSCCDYCCCLIAVPNLRSSPRGLQGTYPLCWGSPEFCWPLHLSGSAPVPGWYRQPGWGWSWHHQSCQRAGRPPWSLQEKSNIEPGSSLLTKMWACCLLALFHWLQGVSQGNLWPIVPRKTPPLWHFGFTIFKLLYLPFMSFLAAIAINSILTGPVVISRTGEDKFSTNTVIQEQVPSHDVAADGKMLLSTPPYLSRELGLSRA